jgi:ABC-type uncharacterized transport system YnjBCD ATPase subunit
MLIFDEVAIARSGQRLFQPVSFALEPGEIMTLQGESGLGKSTLLHALIAEEPGVEISGQITIDGTPMDPVTRLSAGSQTVFQEPLLFPHLSVGANIELSMYRLPSASHRMRVNQLLNDLGLGGMATQDPFQLSRGQMMRVAVARALAPHPRILLLDEPLSALDSETRDQVKHRIFKQVQEDGAYGILVTHHPEDRPQGGGMVCLMR